MSTVLDDEQRVDDTTKADNYRALIDRLSRQSVDKHFDAYADVAWDAPEMQIDPTDPRWELVADVGLGQTDWYRGLPQEERARIGLYRVARSMKIGVQFESVLKRGLLDYASTLPNGAPEFRYLYHEVIEEAQHSLMFQEFVNRSGFDPPGLPWPLRIGSRFVVRLARRHPPLFFMFVLGGEDPIDYTQRRQLKDHAGQGHPLLERIMRIHVTEEARHLSFARHYLRHEVPRLGRLRRALLAVKTPLLLGEMASQMLAAPATMAGHRLPRETLRQADSNEARQFVRDSVAKVRRLCVELGLVGTVSRRLWKAVGLWDEPR
ncbi:MAG: AurF N-oxygenase family protein [Acidimicrobiales bacterium]